MLNQCDQEQMNRIFLMAVYLIWAGILLGVSFIATPVKFQAPNLTMPVALEVGKATFHLLNPLEWGIFAVSGILTILPGANKGMLCMLLLLAVLLVLQTFWLLPILDERADAVIAGNMPEPGYLHQIYIALELAKLFSILCAAWICLKKE